MRRTKIVATLGPATDSPDKIAGLIRAGMNVARMNFSHGSHKEHRDRYSRVRELSDEIGQPVAILQDLQGPKMRTGNLENGEPVMLEAGATVTLTTDDVIGTAERISTNYEPLPRDVQPGDFILLSDGLLKLQAREVHDNDVITEVIARGKLRERQGINLPGTAISAPSVTGKDVKDLAFGLNLGVDYVAISFVRRPDDVLEVKRLIAKSGRDVPVIAKIERPEALACLQDILDVADGVMVARGDLGVEIPLDQVPIIQKEIIASANTRAVPVITATQMLESMIRNPNPTRAEVSDVANAIIDGSDAVMLSGETSIGDYPLQAVRTMAEIAETVEASAYCVSSAQADSPSWLLQQVQSVPEAIGAAVSAIVNTLEVHAIWVFTQTGSTARQVAHYRPQVPIVAMTPFDHVLRRLCLNWGVQPLKVEFFEDDREFWEQLVPFVVQHGKARPGETVVITGGHPFNQHGPTNFLKIQQVTEETATNGEAF